MTSRLLTKEFLDAHSAWSIEHFERPSDQFGYMASGHFEHRPVPKDRVIAYAQALTSSSERASAKLYRRGQGRRKIALERVRRGDFVWDLDSGLSLSLDAGAPIETGIITRGLASYVYMQFGPFPDNEVSESHVLGLVQQVFQRLRPEYGYIFAVLMHRLAPMECSCATIDSSDVYMDRRLGLRSKRAGPGVGGNARMAWQFNLHQQYFADGILRDVLRENFLTQVHLDWDCRGQRFQDWIEGDPARGSLTPFTDEMWRWSVPDESIAMIEEACFDFGLLQTRDQIGDDWQRKQAERGSGLDSA